ncbi:MAG: serine/threonine protein kinase [Gemmatimonadaceae bacterium]|nr:serine/threonine protein kinase [Gemmatimonadaceae bacterium]
MKHGSLLHLAQSVKDRNLPDRYLGRQIGKYQVIRLLGGGAFAWVYEAVDRDLEIPVALKILRPEFAGQADAEARFRREATTAARLRHPNIVTVRDVGLVDGASFVAMDLLPLSLARRLELLSRLAEADVVRIGLDVAAALSVAHAGGIVHRDIKPDNILIGTHGEAVVADFGLARVLDDGAARSGGHQIMGTPHYFSPEQARGLELDGRSDLYSLGVTLFRAATGRLPYEGDDWYAVARMHVEAPVPSARALVPELSEAIDALLGRLMQKAPADRFPTALAVADALAALPSAPVTRSSVSLGRASSETVTAFPPVTERLPSPPATARRWVGATIGLALVGIAGWAALRVPTIRDLIARSPEPTLPHLDDSTTRALQDSVRLAAGDTAAAVAVSDSSRRTPLVVSRLPDSIRKKAADRVKTQLIVSAPDSARLYVDGALAGRGSIVVDRPGAARLSLRAVIEDAPTDCVTASRDSTIRLAVGERRSVMLAVRTCLGVKFTIVPADARIRFESLDGGVSVEVRADTTKSVLLSEGRYEVRATAPRCLEYRGDTLTVRRGASESSLFRSIRLTC